MRDTCARMYSPRGYSRQCVYPVLRPEVGGSTCFTVSCSMPWNHLAMAFCPDTRNAFFGPPQVQSERPCDPQLFTDWNLQATCASDQHQAPQIMS